ncbi:hypothetical protein L9F63_021059, partial [Diploptera punctata]
EINWEKLEVHNIQRQQVKCQNQELQKQFSSQMRVVNVNSIENVTNTVTKYGSARELRSMRNLEPMMSDLEDFDHVFGIHGEEEFDRVYQRIQLEEQENRHNIACRRRNSGNCSRLTVLSLGNGGGVVECQLESSKHKTVTFTFHTQDVVPQDIATNLVAENLLPEHHSDIFIELINDIVRQLKENPERVPVLPHCPLDSPVTSRKPRDRERDPLAESQSRVRHSSLTRQSSHRASYKGHRRHRSRDETATVSKLVDPIVRERASLSGPSSPMHVLQQHPLTYIAQQLPCFRVPLLAAKREQTESKPVSLHEDNISDSNLEGAPLKKRSSIIDPDGSEGPSRKTSVASDRAIPTAGTSQFTPENTVTSAMFATADTSHLMHPRLSQQNSLEKDSGPQTIADLQQKLVKLTSQPTELMLSGTPPSHPATPQVQHSYDSYIQTLQQKLASISMPGTHTLGPLSPQSTLHAAVAAGSAIPTAIDVVAQPIMSIEGVAVLPPDHHVIMQPVAMIAPVQQMSVTPLVDSSNSSSGVMSPSQLATRDETQRQQRPRPAAIDLHDLEQELAKIHTGHRPVPLNQPQTILPAAGNVQLTQLMPQGIGSLLPVPTPIQPTNTPVFPTAGLHPTSAPIADISVNTTPDECNVMENRTELLHATNNTEMVVGIEYRTAGTEISNDGNVLNEEKKQELQDNQTITTFKTEEIVPVKKISRFQVSVVKEEVTFPTPADDKTESEITTTTTTVCTTTVCTTTTTTTTTTAVRRGRFSVVTHTEDVMPQASGPTDEGFTVVSVTIVTIESFSKLPSVHGSRPSNISNIGNVQVIPPMPLFQEQDFGSRRHTVHHNIPPRELLVSVTESTVEILHKGKPPLHISDTNLSKPSLMHSNSVADFRHMNPDLMLGNRIRTYSQSSDVKTDPTIKHARNLEPIQRWCSSSNLDYISRPKTGFTAAHFDDTLKKVRKMNEKVTSLQRRKLPITPFTAKPFDIKHSSLSQMSTKYSSMSDLSKNESLASQRPQYRRCMSTEQHTLDANNPFKNLIKPSNPFLSQDSLETKPSYLTLSQEPRELLKAKLKQAKSMSNLALYNRNQAMRVSPNSSPISSPTVSRSSLHPNDAFSILQRKDVKDMDSKYHTIHAGMQPPSHLAEWGYKMFGRSRSELEDKSNLSEAHSDESQEEEEDMFYSHVIPSTSPRDQDNVFQKMHRDDDHNAGDYMYGDTYMSTVGNARKTLDQAVGSESVQYTALPSKPRAVHEKSYEDLLQTGMRFWGTSPWTEDINEGVTHKKEIFNPVLKLYKKIIVYLLFFTRLIHLSRGLLRGLANGSLENYRQKKKLTFCVKKHRCMRTYSRKHVVYDLCTNEGVHP